MEVLPELAEGACSASVSNKSGGYAQVTALARLRGWEAVPLELPWTVVREANKAGEMMLWTVIFFALHLWEK